VSTTKIVSSKTHSIELYAIQHYVIKFDSDSRQISGFLRTLVSSITKADLHDISEILSKVVLNTITLTLQVDVHLMVKYKLNGLNL
jgi:hypothetical protein